jgi:hypothetical protein
MKPEKPISAAQRDLLKSAREMMADARRQMRDCSTWMHETVEITYTDAAGGPVPRPSAIGWECPKCGRVYSPNTSACAACNEEPPECMR